ncbi:DNA polymerase II large subunit [archaeon]|nr:DNA polymerase II large subunit [archaeon]
MSKNFEKYFEKLDNQVSKAYLVANKARAKGYDPVDKVEIPIAKNMAERVEGLISVVAPQLAGSGVSQRIIELEKEYGIQHPIIAFLLSVEVAKQMFCKFEDEKEAIEVGLRVGLAYITNGVVASPLEGFVRLELKDTLDGSGKYFALYFGGPIRSAGTTATCFFVACADYVRRQMGYQAYDPTEDEIKRTFSELDFFNDRITNLQYMPSEEESDYITKFLPLQIEGDASEKIEVPNYKDLPRVSTNKLRNGFCLVVGEGLALKWKKFWGKFSKWCDQVDMKDWKFVDGFIKLQEQVRAKKIIKKEDVGEKILPDYGFIKDIVAGRPVFGHPLESGGFRLRYGRTRMSGFSVDALHPATGVVLDGYVASGTQLKPERPKKGNTVVYCDSIEGPIVKLKNGCVLRLESQESAEKVNKDVEEVLYLGDILMDYGDFLDRGSMLYPVGYCEEWWFKEVEATSKTPEEIEKLTKIKLPLLKGLFNNPLLTKLSAKDAFEISKRLKIPLHPRYIFHWKSITIKEFLVLIGWLLRGVIKKQEEKIILPLNYKVEEYENPKRILELLGVPHIISNKEFVVLEGNWASALMINLGFYGEEDKFKKMVGAVSEKKDILKMINKFSEVEIRDKSGIFIGARMGRPEKGKMRKLTGSPHVLFPVGEEGGRLRSFQAAMEEGKVSAEIPLYKCNKCNNDTVYPVCEVCENKTDRLYFCKSCNKIMDEEKCKQHGPCMPYKLQDIQIQKYLNNAQKKLGLKDMPALIKGVRGTISVDHTPENLVKGILRAIHSINVNKDGTIRFDMTEMTITHFKPNEIGTSIEKIKELGYDKDIYGGELISGDQIVEIKAQDVILPSPSDSLEEGADVILYRVANFIDDLLEKFYGVEKFYNIKDKSDLIGHLVVGLSPHTCAGIVCRIIGFSKMQGLVAHPYLHSIMRRDCDGDEAGIMFLMDALLNFSRKLLGGHRGATQDEPLILTTHLQPTEVDDQVYSMGVSWSYPLEFYKACSEFKYPWDIKIETVQNKLDSGSPFEGFGFTHPTNDINAGVLCSSYKLLPTMKEKVEGQMALADKIRAVDEDDVARLVIERHFIRDLKGNLRKFSMQQFRCVKCNEKFRRPPLVGKCTRCGGKLLFTISEGSVTKYLGHTLYLASQYKLPPYSMQAIELLKERIESVFGKDPEKQSGLKDFFS